MLQHHHYAFWRNHVVMRERSQEDCHRLSLLYGGTESTLQPTTGLPSAQVIAVAIPLGAGIGIGLGIQDEVKGWYKVRTPHGL